MLLNKVEKNITEYKLMENSETVVVGVSGGPDSIALLHILYALQEKLGYSLIAVHINHQIRSDANKDEEYVKEFCKKRKIPFYAKRVAVEKIAKEQKITTEVAGRVARYEFFEEIAKQEGATKIATAHNQNDQAETILMNIIRGTGLLGLTGIEIKNGNKIRPLLTIPRKEIEEYCKKHQLNPRIDSTNAENIYHRNKIRNVVIPYLEKECNSNTIEALTRLGNIATEEQEYIKLQVEKAYQEIKKEEEKEVIVLDWEKFNLLPLIIRKNILFYCSNKLLGTARDIEKINIEDMIGLCEKKVGNKYIMPNANLKIYVNRGAITISKQKN